MTLIEEYIAADDSYAFLNVPAGRLSKGSKYRFKLTVNDGSEDGVATMVVEVRSGPTSGSLSVDKNPVQALFDEVTLSGKHATLSPYWWPQFLMVRVRKHCFKINTFYDGLEWGWSTT